MAGGNRPAYCGQCGSPVQEGDQFCGICGAAVLPPASQAEQVIPRPVAAAQSPSRGRRRPFLLAGVLGALAVLLVGGGVAALLVSGAEEQDLYGEWTGRSYDGQAISLTFNPDGTVQLVVDNDVGSGTYRVDMNEKPPHLDIDWGERGEVRTIFEFVDDNRIRLEDIDPGEERSTSFGETSSVVLTKGGPSAAQRGSDDPAENPASAGSEQSGSSGQTYGANTAEEEAGSSAPSSPEPTTPTSAPPLEVTTAPPEEVEPDVEEAVEDYYYAVDREDWDLTYENLDSGSQALFTEVEWSQKNQWYADNEGLELSSMSVDVTVDPNGFEADVTVYRTFEDGTSITRDTEFVLEGSWKHRLTAEEVEIFRPELSYEEFVEAQQ